MKVYIANAFSLSMLSREAQDGTPLGYTPTTADAPTTARIPRPCYDPKAVIASWEGVAQIVSAVGHADTATLLGQELEREVPANRVSISLEPGDVLLVGQYVGPRLPEGATTLPEGATIEWWVVV